MCKILVFRWQSDTSNFPLTVCTYFSPLFPDFRQLTPVLTYYFYPITPPKKSWKIGWKKLLITQKALVCCDINQVLPRLVYASIVYPTCSSNFMSCKTNALIIFFYILIFWLLQKLKIKWNQQDISFNVKYPNLWNTVGIRSCVPLGQNKINFWR